jgi:hypothetical protein
LHNIYMQGSGFKPWPPPKNSNNEYTIILLDTNNIIVIILLDTNNIILGQKKNII